MFSLSHILLGAGYACDGINKIGTSASDIFLVGMFLACDMASYNATLVDFGAVSAFFVCADVVGSNSGPSIVQ